MNQRPHLSYLAISQYLRCPLQFYFKRILGLQPEFTPSGLALGSAIHEALAEYHRGIQNQQPTTPQAVRESFLEAWNTRKTFEEIALEGNKTEAEIVEQGVALIDTYLKEPPPENIVAVELEMLAPLHNSQGEVLEKPLTVVIDLITQPQEGMKITDLKSSGRAYSDMEASLSLQATCYLNAAWANLGQMPRFEYTVLIKTKTPRVQRLETTRSESDLARLGDLVQAVDRAVEQEVFFPVESPLNCSGCPFRKACKQWTGNPVQPSMIDEENACLASRNQEDAWESA